MYHDASFAVLWKVSERLVVLPICIAECTHLREGFGIISTLFPFRFIDRVSRPTSLTKKITCLLYLDYTTSVSVTIFTVQWTFMWYFIMCIYVIFLQLWFYIDIRLCNTLRFCPDIVRCVYVYITLCFSWALSIRCTKSSVCRNVVYEFLCQ